MRGRDSLATAGGTPALLELALLENDGLNITTFIIVSVIKTVLALFVLLTAVAYTVWLERKVIGHMQNRWGPTRVGPFGLLQPIADGLKFIVKEDMLPPGVNKPLIVAALALTSLSVIPFGETITLFGRTIPLQIAGFWDKAAGAIYDPGVGL